jgi:hypothetical protein
MKQERLPQIGAACFLVGLAVLFLIDAGIARAIAIPLIFVGIALGVTAIASPSFLERDRDGVTLPNLGPEDAP